MNPAKIRQYLGAAYADPREAIDRAKTSLEGRREFDSDARNEYNPVGRSEAFGALSDALGLDLEAVHGEEELAEVEASIEEGQARLVAESSWSRPTDGGRQLGRLCYCLIRARKPEVVVETGVAYGVTTAYMLAALEANETGHLHSVDIPPLGKEADAFVGCLAPQELKKRWSLYRGSSRQIFPVLLRHLPYIDMFVHDSLHTYRTMLFEFEAVTPLLTDKAVVVSDDVHENAAWADWTETRPDSLTMEISEDNKDVLLGVSLS